MYLILLLTVFGAVFIQIISERLEVVCPPFEGFDADSSFGSFSARNAPRILASNNDYCQCSMTEHGTAKTAILKCEFNNEKDIILKESMFPFKNYSVTSAYVRMRNAKSATISSEFLASWMDAPSSALDIWHCGKVAIESTPRPHDNQLFKNLKTFVGVGIIDCTIDSLPSFFIRDRSRGALRLKDCSVGTINAGMLHNIEEVRYLNFEDTTVQRVEGPLSSSGVITLSKKEIHSWDGIEFINSSFQHVASFSFNVTHKDIMEKFVIKQSSFGYLQKGALSATGDIDVVLMNNSFSHLDSLAIQVSVNGDMSFSNNIIQEYELDSLSGLTCRNDSSLNNNTFYIPSKQSKAFVPFMDQCGKPQVSYIVMAKLSDKSSRATSIAVTVVILSMLALAVLLFLWAWRNRSLFRFHYRRSDTPLWRDERAPDGEEDHTPQDVNATSVVHNPTYLNEKINL